MKILYVTTIGGTMGFFPEHIKMLQSLGHTVELACNTDNSPVAEVLKKLTVHNIPFSRSPLTKQNVEGYKQIKHLIKAEHYDLVHTHTPNASVCVRLACRKLRKKGLKVYYTAHGFHFYKGAPMKNWLLYYPVEWLCAHWTDTLITINKEDYRLAKKHMHAGRVCYVPGVGLDLEKFGCWEIDRKKARKSVNVPDGMAWLFSVGELSQRKNHEPLIHAVAQIPNVYLTIAGQGVLQDYLQDLIRSLHVEDRVKLLGYRTDISDLCKSADIYVHPALQEGLPVAVMEAMAFGLPCVVSRIRGNTDLINEKGGCLFDPNSVDEIKAAINKVIVDGRRHEMGEHNRKKIQHYDFSSVLDKLKSIYGGDMHVADLLTRFELRQSIDCGNEDLLLLSVGELNENKNHEVVIRALQKLNRNVYYVIAGQGHLKKYLENLAKECGVSERVHFLGYITNVSDWYKAADVFVFPSYREGLSVSLMEAMASGLSCVVSRIRGNVDLIGDGFEPGDVDSVVKALKEVDMSAGERNRERIKDFSQKFVIEQIGKIYAEERGIGNVI